jgi:hypothetical protein
MPIMEITGGRRNELRERISPMHLGLRARRPRAQSTSKRTTAGRLNAVEMLMFGLIALAMVDCSVIGWLVAHGLGN